jgi:hypothetical protein
MPRKVQPSLVIYNSMRYGDCKYFPARMVVIDGTTEQALMLAERMSDYYPGQQGMFLVEGHEDEYPPSTFYSWRRRGTDATNIR